MKWVVCSFQEMEHILEHIKSSRLVDNNQPDEFDHEQNVAEDIKDESAAERELSVKPKKQKRLQTMVFSATLTLPQHLRKRLKKGWSPCLQRAASLNVTLHCTCYHTILAPTAHSNSSS